MYLSNTLTPSSMLWWIVIIAHLVNGQDQKNSLSDSPFCVYDDPMPYYFASCSNASVPTQLDFTGLPDSLQRLYLTNLTVHHSYTAMTPGPSYVDLQLHRRKMVVHLTHLRYIGANDHRLPFERILRNVASIITSLTIEKTFLAHLHEDSFEGFMMLTELRFVDCSLESFHPRLFYPLAYSHNPSWLPFGVLQPGNRSLLQRLALQQNKLTHFNWESLRPIANSIEVLCLDDNSIVHIHEPTYGWMLMPNLYYFSITSNKLTSLPDRVLSIFQPGTYVMAGKNRFACNLCQLMPLVKWAVNNPSVRVENFTCFDDDYTKWNHNRNNNNVSNANHFINLRELGRKFRHNNEKHCHHIDIMENHARQPVHLAQLVLWSVFVSLLLKSLYCR